MKFEIPKVRHSHGFIIEMRNPKQLIFLKKQAHSKAYAFEIQAIYLIWSIVTIGYPMSSVPGESHVD